MDEIPCGSFSAEDLESLYLRRKKEGHVHVDEGRRKKSPCLDKHVLLFPPTSESIGTTGDFEHFKVGRFHEIDHLKLSPISPVQLKSVRIVMVSDIGEHQVSLRYPSLLSLRTHFSDQNFGKPDGKKIPALDEKYVMGLDLATKALNRSIPTEEFAQKRNSWSFWVSPSKENIQHYENRVLADAANSMISKQGSCWSQLKLTGMMQWGKRRQVRFLGRHEEQKVVSLPELRKENGVSVEQREGTSEKKRKKGEEETEADEKGSFGVMRMTSECKKNNQNVSTSSGIQNSTKAKNDSKNQQLVVYNKNKRKISIGRWSAMRYKLAEENMLKVMKEKGAVYGNPILRPQLRSEARKHIGDTGLLDHLLKHMAGKVAPGGVERFRRRHNAEGAMEYWLESADLVDIRKEAGVQDPYWTPPPGWRLGDSISDDQITSRELRQIKEEILKLKQDMQELGSKKEEEALAIVTTPSSCLSNWNSEDYGSLVPKQEIYAELMSKKAKIEEQQAKIEEQLKEISLTLSGMEEQMGILKPTIGEEPIISESVTPPALLPGPTSVAENTGGEITKEKKSNKNKKTKSADKQIQEKSTEAEDKAAKIERLNSGFQICKPQGTFIWPNIGVSPSVVTNLEDHTVVPTPSSASSTTSAPQLLQTEHLPLPVPNPSSPVKPLAERRPVSTATLTHVTRPFSPHLSPPLGTTRSQITSTITKNTSSINLNEAPLTLE